MKAALRKLVRALPESFRDDAEAASAAVVVDPTAWGGTPSTRPTPPHLEVLQRAVIEGEQMRLDYVARDRTSTSRIVHPLGLAAKGQVWYLVADTDSRSAHLPGRPRHRRRGDRRDRSCDPRASTWPRPGA